MARTSKNKKASVSTSTHKKPDREALDELADPLDAFRLPPHLPKKRFGVLIALSLVYCVFLLFLIWMSIWP